MGELDEVLAELVAREPIFHRPEHGTDFDAMMAADFFEVGASGRRYDRATVLGVLEERHRLNAVEDPWRTEDFHCRPLGAGCYALTYTLHQGPRLTRRLTLWQRTPDRRWLILYHQGTLVAD